MFDAFIKLYNLCLSTKQACKYIKECYDLYKQLLNSNYEISNEVELSIRKCRWDGTYRKYITVSAEPNDESEDYYWFEVTFPLLVVDDPINDITAHEINVELHSSYEKLEDALMLFEYHQKSGLLRKVFEKALSTLLYREIIKKENSYISKCGWTIYVYITDIRIDYRY